MSSPKQMAQEYADKNSGGECYDDEPGIKEAFMAGFEAAREIYNQKIRERDWTIDGLCDEIETLKTIIYEDLPKNNGE